MNSENSTIEMSNEERKKTIEIEGINEEDAKNNFIKHLGRIEHLPWNISISDIDEVKMLKCKICGKKLSSEDYLGDYYGKCEGECDLG